MKVLQLCNKPPYPPVDGGSMAMNSITRSLLSEGCEVKVLCVETDKHPVCKERIPADYLQSTSFESVYIDLSVRPIPAVVALLCGESYNVQRYKSDAFAHRLREILQQDKFDVVHVESLFLSPYIPLIRKHSRAKVILRAHNVEFMIWRRMAESCGNIAKRWYLKHLSLSLRMYELEHLNDYDGVVCITRHDEQFFRENGCRRPMTTIPFGVETEEVENVDVEPASLFHIGAMDWLPNCESIDWMLKKVWPVVRKEVPEATLYLAGRKMPQRLLESKIEGVRVIGEVPDANYFIAGKQINVVPLLSGSGIRVKIIEAMSMGKAVVTTTVGAQGIECTHGENILIADSPEDFAQCIKRLVRDEAFCHQLGTAAARLVAEEYNEKKLSKKLLAFYDKIIDR